jgi:hypothetical protein
MTTAYATAESRAAVRAISDILAALPLAQRADIVEEAYGGALRAVEAHAFKALLGNDPIPVLLVGGEIASDAMHHFAGLDDDGHCDECGLYFMDGHLPSCSRHDAAS